MKILKALILFSVAGVSAAQQCGTITVNPFTGKFDCIGSSSGSASPNVSASSTSAVTSLTLNTSALNAANTQSILVQCWTGTTTFTPVAITSLNPVTISGGIVTVVTPNFTSTANVYCAANASGSSGATGPTGPTDLPARLAQETIPFACLLQDLAPLILAHPPARPSPRSPD